MKELCMKSRVCTLLAFVTATVCFGEPNKQEQDEKKAIELWQSAQKIPEGKNQKADIARQVIHGLLKVERILPEGILANGQFSVPGYFKPKNAIVFNNVYRFQADILVVGYKSSVTDGDLFNSVLFPCGTFKTGPRTLKRYATTLEQAFELIQPEDNDINAEIEKLENEKRIIDARLAELRKQKTEKGPQK